MQYTEKYPGYLIKIKDHESTSIIDLAVRNLFAAENPSFIKNAVLVLHTMITEGLSISLTQYKYLTDAAKILDHRIVGYEENKSNFVSPFRHRSVKGSYNRAAFLGKPLTHPSKAKYRKSMKACNYRAVIATLRAHDIAPDLLAAKFDLGFADDAATKRKCSQLIAILSVIADQALSFEAVVGVRDAERRAMRHSNKYVKNLEIDHGACMAKVAKEPIKKTSDVFSDQMESGTFDDDVIEQPAPNAISQGPRLPLLVADKIALKHHRDPKSRRKQTSRPLTLAERMGIKKDKPTMLEIV